MPPKKKQRTSTATHRDTTVEDEHDATDTNDSNAAAASSAGNVAAGTSSTVAPVRPRRLHTHHERLLAEYEAASMRQYETANAPTRPMPLFIPSASPRTGGGLPTGRPTAAASNNSGLTPLFTRRNLQPSSSTAPAASTPMIGGVSPFLSLPSPYSQTFGQSPSQRLRARQIASRSTPTSASAHGLSLEPGSPPLAPVRTSGSGMGSLFEPDESGDHHHHDTSHAHQFQQMEFALDGADGSDGPFHSSSHLSLAIPHDDESRDIIQPMDYAQSSDVGTLFEGFFPNAMPTPSHGQLFTPLSSPSRGGGDRTMTSHQQGSHNFLFPPGLTPRFQRDPSQTSQQEDEQHHLAPPPALPSPARYLDAGFSSLPALPSPGARTLATPSAAAGTHGDAHYHPSSRAATTPAHWQMLHSPAVHSSASTLSGACSTPLLTSFPASAASSFSFSPMPITTSNNMARSTQAPTVSRKLTAAPNLALAIPPTPAPRVTGKRSRTGPLAVLASPANRLRHMQHPAVTPHSALASASVQSQPFLPDFLMSPAHHRIALPSHPQGHMYDDHTQRIDEEDATGVDGDQRQHDHVHEDSDMQPTQSHDHAAVDVRMRDEGDEQEYHEDEDVEEEVQAQVNAEPVAAPDPPVSAIVVSMDTAASDELAEAIDYSQVRGAPAASMEPILMASNPFANDTNLTSIYPQLRTIVPPLAAEIGLHAQADTAVATSITSYASPPTVTPAIVPSASDPAVPLAVLSSAALFAPIVASASSAAPPITTPVSAIALNADVVAVPAATVARPIPATVPIPAATPTPAALPVPAGTLRQSATTVPGSSTAATPASVSAAAALATASASSATLPVASVAPSSIPVAPGTATTVHAAVALSSNQTATPAQEPINSAVSRGKRGSGAQKAHQARTVVSTAKETVAANVLPTNTASSVLAASTVIAAGAATPAISSGNGVAQVPQAQQPMLPAAVPSVLPGTRVSSGVPPSAPAAQTNVSTASVPSVPMPARPILPSGPRTFNAGVSLVPFSSLPVHDTKQITQAASPVAMTDVIQPMPTIPPAPVVPLSTAPSPTTTTAAEIPTPIVSFANPPPVSDMDLLRQRVKIPHTECQSMVVDGVHFLAERFLQPVDARNTRNEAEENTHPEPDEIEHEQFAPIRRALLAHLTSTYPNELDFLLYRLSQHCLYIHAYGWRAYDTSFTHAPPVPQVRLALQSSLQHTAVQKAAKQVKVEKAAQQIHQGAKIPDRARSERKHKKNTQTPPAASMTRHAGSIPVVPPMSIMNLGRVTLIHTI